MRLSSEHQLAEVLWVRGSFHVVKAVRKKDASKVLVAGYDERLHDAEFDERLSRDAALIQAATGQEVTLECEGGRLLAQLPDRGAVRLSRLLVSGAPSVERCLQLFCSLTRFLVFAHARGVVTQHWVESVFIQQDTNEVICFPESAAPLPSSNRLAHASSKQLTCDASADTGADIYALGVSFCRALTGAYPSGQRDTELLELPATCPPAAPEAELEASLLAVTNKLLARSSAARYRSAASVLADLEQCRRRLQATPGGRAFEPGILEVHARIDALPVLGRERELARMRDIWGCVEQQGARALFVSGPAGIGKSALIEAFRSQIGERCCFAAGKFDQVHRGLASGGLMVALRSLVDALLSTDARTLAAMRHKLTEAIGRTASVLVERVPELRRLVELSDAPRSLPADQARNRLEHALVQFVSTAASLQPLVLFVDDLQWCDSASARLIGALLLRARGPLLVIGTYRPLPSSSHPVDALLLELREDPRGCLTELQLEAMDEATLASAVQRVFRAPVENLPVLVGILRSKSGGNPFYFRGLLRHVFDSGLVVLDEAAQSWRIDAVRLRALSVAENLVDFLLATLESLSADQLALCRSAACLGSEFDLHTLAELSGHDVEHTRRLLAALSERHLLAPLAGATERYAFAHDRVHQLAYDGLSESARASLHAHAARLFLREQEGDLFLIVDHVNKGASAADSVTPELRRRLNLRAGERALQETAYAAASEYLERAAEGFERRGQPEDRDFALALAQARANVEYLRGRPEQAELHVRAALDDARTVASRADLYELYLTVLTVASRYADALVVAGEALGELGVTLERPQVGEAAAHVGLEPTRVLDLVEAEAMNDPRAAAATRILVAMLPLTFLGDPSLLPAAVTRAVELALEHGPSAESATAIAAFGALLAADGHYRAAFECGRSANALAHRFTDLSQRARSGEIFIACLAHWAAPLRDSGPLAEDAYQAGLDSGDLQYAGYARFYDAVNRFHAGHPLPRLRAFCEDAAELLGRTKNRVAGDVVESTLRIIDDLLEGSSERLDDDARHLADCRAGGGELSCCIYLVMKAEVLLRRGRLLDSLDTLDRAAELLSLAPGVISTAIHVFVRAQVLARLAGEASGERRRELLHRARADLATLAGWAVHSPENFRHKQQLVSAELHRVDGELLAAQRAYDDAMSGASSSGYLQDDLLATQRANDLCLQMGLRTQAAALSERAAELARRWGERSLIPTHDDAEPDAVDTLVDPRWLASPAALLGLRAALRASQKIAETLDLAQVLRLFVQMAVTHSGADRAVLLLCADEEFDIAESLPACPEQDARPLEHRVPAQIVRFTARTAKSVELRAGQIAPQFDFDPYLRRHRPAALFATPLIHGALVLGVLYLESRDNTQLFPAQIRQLLELLSSGATVALENARLFESLAREVEYRRSAEHRLEASLREKSRLVQELHHRVNNNLQVLSSLLYLQITKTSDGSARTVLVATRQRLRAVALVHQQLDSDSLDSVLDVQRYVRQLSDRLHQVHAAQVSLVFELCDGLQLGVAQAIPFGLLLNELLSNALIHAFPGGGKGRVCVTVERLDVDRVRLLVADEGVGLPGGDNSAHFGLDLADKLASQLGGRLHARSENGARFWTEFKLEPARAGAKG